jgi:hypothetical protein
VRLVAYLFRVIGVLSSFTGAMEPADPEKLLNVD